MKSSSILHHPSSIRTLRVGVFDSGLGGLTVVKSILSTLKGAELFYIADTKHAPYGEKSKVQILAYSLEITRYFIEKHQIDALVVACNTATSAAIETLRETYPELIIVGTEPGIKPAIETTRSGRVGVLATPATLRGEKYQQLVDAHVDGKEIALYEQACPGLVEKIEQGKTEHPETEIMLRSWLDPMREQNVDTIVLGCTHYPLVSNLIEKIMEHRLTLIHTGDAIAKRLLTLAEAKGHRNVGSTALYVYATGPIEEEIMMNLMGKCISVSSISTTS